MIDILITLGVIVVLLLLQGFFSGSEIALVNADKLHLRHLANKGRRGAQLVLRMFKHPEVLLGTTLVGTNISLVALTTLGTLLLVDVFGPLGDVAALLILTPLTLVFGEVVPKSVYQQNADRFAPRIIYPLRVFSLVFYPVVLVFSTLARLVVRLSGVTPARHALFTTREQVRLMLEGAEQAADVDVFDRDRLLRAVKFAGITVGEVMVPIGEVTMLNLRDTTEEAIAIVRQRGYAHLPLYEDEPGEIVGVINMDIWQLMDPELAGRDLRELSRPALFVVKNQLVDEIVTELRESEEQLAIVVDEFGSAVGMVTLEDILEQVIGEVAHMPGGAGDAGGRRKALIEQRDPESYRIDGRALLVDVTEILGIGFQHSNVHTLGGLMISKLRRLPREGDSLVTEGYRFTVEQAGDRGVNWIIAEPD